MKILTAILTLLLVGAATSTPVTSDARDSVRFTSVDVFVDPQGTKLAAYQVEFVADDRVKLVGIEGGEASAYSAPPYYDPAALSRKRVIVAAFSTASDLPTAATRVARLHLQVTGEQTPDWKVKLIVAADASGNKIRFATARLSEGAKQ